MLVHKKDIVVLNDNRQAIVHEIYSDGNVLLIEIIDTNSTFPNLPLVSTKLVKKVLKTNRIKNIDTCL